VYARSTTVKAQNNAIDQGIAQVRDEVLPAVTAMDGCVGLSMMVDRTSGECIVTTAWETEEKMRATTEAVKPLRERATEILSGTSSVQEWEIAVVHRDHQAGDGSFCRSTWLATEPSNTAHALDVYRMAILPKIEELDGFCSASMLVDRATGMAVGTVAFDSREALDASRAAGEAIRAAASKEIGAQILDVHEYELALAHLHVPEMA
jgi:quinol monooxygenase YgiN